MRNRDLRPCVERPSDCRLGIHVIRGERKRKHLGLHRLAGRRHHAPCAAEPLGGSSLHAYRDVISRT